MTVAHQFAQKVGEKWGKALTTAMTTGDMTEFKALFISDEAVGVVIQSAEGTEVVMTIGDVEGATLSWDEFKESSMKDLEEQGYLKTESQCLGVLGDRMILEAGRFNKAGEEYMSAYSLLTLNEEGKITMFESFSDAHAPGLIQAASLSE
ncbi:hypothetical protein FisN_1Hh148 [Fistulifera solaris]|jgi:hypothetical protein|uniref:SnoaL-like domain-containing protein n=1 Tax=Fistulifera solaris TaxID=1519565 RepID=A0A1Z5JE13_FISSO|nr:hypothetical protein FisN_1Hh148 [Fistulifera solaris]|eukprot:GAX12219.1 hypothetical protein FisN_1Hh148 [Fistulifera solaris]